MNLNDIQKRLTELGCDHIAIISHSKKRGWFNVNLCGPDLRSRRRFFASGMGPDLENALAAAIRDWESLDEDELVEDTVPALNLSMEDL